MGNGGPELCLLSVGAAQTCQLLVVQEQRGFVPRRGVRLAFRKARLKWLLGNATEQVQQHVLIYQFSSVLRLLLLFLYSIRYEPY